MNTNEQDNICYSANEELFNEDIGSIIDEVLSNNETVDDAKEAIVYVGEAVRPNIKGSHLADNIAEYISDDLYDLCGEYSENFEISKDDFAELTEFLNVWISKQKFNCFSVEKVKQTKLTDYMTIEEIEDYYKP